MFLSINIFLHHLNNNRSHIVSHCLSVISLLLLLVLVLVVCFGCCYIIVVVAAAGSALRPVCAGATRGCAC